MSALRFVALGDSLTEGVGDPVDGAWRGWAALLAEGLSGGPVEFHNLAVSGARTRDLVERQCAVGLALRPDVVSVVAGVNDTLRGGFDIRTVAACLDEVCGAFAARGAVLLTACLPDPGAMLGLPGLLGGPLARRQRAVNAVVHALSERYGAVHLHAHDEPWIAQRSMWSVDRLHPGERGHRQFAARFHALLAREGVATGPAPSTEPQLPPPTAAAGLRWMATAGTGWVVRRCTDLVPQLLGLAGEELHHWLRGTRERLDRRAADAVGAALAALSPSPPPAEEAAGTGVPAPRGQVRLLPTGTNRTGVPGSACAADGRSAARTTAITG